MAEKIIMPKQGLQMTAGTVVRWLAMEGDKIQAGEPLFELETDKVTMMIDSPVSGTLLKIVAAEGEMVPVAELIAIAGEPGEDISKLIADVKKPVVPAVVPVGVSESPQVTPVVSVTRAAGERVFISPRAKRIAEESGIDYSKIAGTAPDGMIIERDILAAKAAKPLASPLTGNLFPMQGMRKVIAERMKYSLNENAQAVHRISVRMDHAINVRNALNKTVSFNDIILMATARALTEYPAINSELLDEGIWRKDFVNLGVAIALDDGLLVPVIKNADRLTLSEISRVVKELAENARNGKLHPDDMTGASFTVSNLGMYGLTDFEAIINPPQAGILAVGKIEDTVLAVDGKVEIHPVVRLTLSYDHRIVDGAPAAQFLSRVKEYLENPYLLF